MIFCDFVRKVALNKYSNIRFLCICVLLAITGSGCATLSEFNDAYMKPYGNKILKTAGFPPPKGLTDAAVGLSKSMRDLSREEEYYLGRAVAARILALYKVSNNQALQKYVSQVGYLLAQESSRPQTFGGYYFTVLNSDSINAFAAPGGFIFITTGLLKILPDEDALASVLGHEVAHVALRHGEKAISDKNMNDALMNLGQLAGTLSCPEIVQQASAVFGSAVEDVVSQLLEQGYSRDQEEEADEAGYIMLVNSGYAPESAGTVFNILRAGNTRQEGGWFSSHPDIEDRIEDLKDLDISVPGDPARGYAARKKRFLKFTR